MSISPAAVAALDHLAIPPELGGGIAVFAVIDAAEAPDGYRCVGHQAGSGYSRWLAGPDALELVLSGRPMPPRLLATGHVVAGVEALLEQGWKRADWAVFDGGPVGPLGLRRPAIRDGAGIVRFLLADGDAADPLAHLFTATPSASQVAAS